jgi:hypothetical protein
MTNGSGVVGGTGFLKIDILAVVLLGAALAYGAMHWRSRNRAEKAMADRKAAELAKRRDPDEI